MESINVKSLTTLLLLLFSENLVKNLYESALVR